MPETDYKRMWVRLRNEMLCLNQDGVTRFHPVIVLGYMDFLEQIEGEKKEGENEATA